MQELKNAAEIAYNVCIRKMRDLDEIIDDKVYFYSINKYIYIIV